MLSRNFVFGAEDKNSFDMGFRGLKDHPQFFVCKSEVLFFKWSLITTPILDTLATLVPPAPSAPKLPVPPSLRAPLASKPISTQKPPRPQPLSAVRAKAF